MNLICGINPVLEALAAGTRHFDRLLIVKGLRSRRLADAIRRATQLGIPLRFEMREALDRLAGGIPHQGVIAIVSSKPLLALEELLETLRNPALLVVLDGVEDPRNLGAILRTAEAAGADGVVLPDRHSAGISETVGRASAGALEHVRLARVGNVVQALEALKARGLWVVGLDAAGTQRWDAVDLRQPVALVLGGEGRGIRRLVREHCDHLVAIPHFGHVSSLNVSVAAGIVLYEAVRQRGTVPSQVRPIPARPIGSPQIVGPGPDDDETDPGASIPGGADRAGQDRDDEGATDDEGDVAQRVDVHVDMLDDVAWGGGPTILKPVGFGTLRRPGGGGRRRRGGPRRPAPVRPNVSPQSEASPRADLPPEREGRHRRKRRRHRGSARPGVAGTPTADAFRTPNAQDGAEGPPPAEAGPGPGSPHRRSGRRKRRRRRHRP
jgi:23S rRNA (guanosine2251-2'-O)-methyltransferase